jgi:DNA adenine methylase
MNDIGETDMDIVLPYIGSKKRLFGVVKENLPKHSMYIEPFAGGFSLGLSLIEAGLVQSAILNDIDSKVATFWAVLKHNHWDLACGVDNLISIHQDHFFDRGEEYTRLQFESTVVDKVTESALLYIFKKMNRGKAGTHINDRLQFGTMAYTDVFTQASRLLENVLVSNKSFQDLACFDSESTFWYLDPPYYNYGKMNFYSSEEGYAFDHLGLSNFCRFIRGKFLLSYDDCEHIRYLFDGFHIESIKVPSKISLSGYSEEILVSNYPITINEIEFSIGRRKTEYSSNFTDEEYELTLDNLFTQED